MIYYSVVIITIGIYIEMYIILIDIFTCFVVICKGLFEYFLSVNNENKQKQGHQLFQ